MKEKSLSKTRKRSQSADLSKSFDQKSANKGKSVQKKVQKMA